MSKLELTNLLVALIALDFIVMFLLAPLMLLCSVKLHRWNSKFAWLSAGIGIPAIMLANFGLLALFPLIGILTGI